VVSFTITGEMIDAPRHADVAHAGKSDRATGRWPVGSGVAATTSMETTTHPQQLQQRSPLATLAETEDVAASLYRSLSSRWDDRHSLRIVDVLLSNHRNNRDVLEDLAGRDDLPPAKSPDDRGGLVARLDAAVARADELVAQRARRQAISLFDLEELERSILAAYEFETVPETENVSDHAQRVLREQVTRRARQNIRVLKLMPHRRDDTMKTGEVVRSEGWVDAVADQSFPASDPPPWTGSHA